MVGAALFSAVEGRSDPEAEENPELKKFLDKLCSILKCNRTGRRLRGSGLAATVEAVSSSPVTSSQLVPISKSCL